MERPLRATAATGRPRHRVGQRTAGTRESFPPVRASAAGVPAHNGHARRGPTARGGPAPPPGAELPGAAGSRRLRQPQQSLHPAAGGRRSAAGRRYGARGAPRAGERPAPAARRRRLCDARRVQGSAADRAPGGVGAGRPPALRQPTPGRALPDRQRWLARGASAHVRGPRPARSRGRLPLDVPDRLRPVGPTVRPVAGDPPVGVGHQQLTAPGQGRRRGGGVVQPLPPPAGSRGDHVRSVHRLRGACRPHVRSGPAGARALPSNRSSPRGPLAGRVQADGPARRARHAGRARGAGVPGRGRAGTGHRRHLLALRRRAVHRGQGPGGGAGRRSGGLPLHDGRDGKNRGGLRDTRGQRRHALPDRQALGPPARQGVGRRGQRGRALVHHAAAQLVRS